MVTTPLQTIYGATLSSDLAGPLLELSDSAPMIANLSTQSPRFSELQEHKPEKLHEGVSNSSHLIVRQLSKRLRRRQLRSGCC
jgi:hypothetical protein